MKVENKKEWRKIRGHGGGGRGRRGKESDRSAREAHFHSNITFSRLLFRIGVVSVSVALTLSEMRCRHGQSELLM